MTTTTATTTAPNSHLTPCRGVLTLRSQSDPSVGGQPSPTFESQHAMKMASSTHETVYTERVAAARLSDVPAGGQFLNYDSQHALAMACATRVTAHAEKEAAARQLEEGKLFVEMLQHRLDRAQRNLHAQISESRCGAMTLSSKSRPAVAAYPPLSYEEQHAIPMLHTKDEDVSAERDAAARELAEGKLFVQRLEHQLEMAQWKLEMAKEQINVTRKLIHSDISPLIVERLRERSLFHARILNDSEAAIANLGTSLDLDSDDEGSAVS